jgi:hypothetical protein
MLPIICYFKIRKKFLNSDAILNTVVTKTRKTL